MDYFTHNAVKQRIPTDTRTAARAERSHNFLAGVRFRNEPKSEHAANRLLRK